MNWKLSVIILLSLLSPGFSPSPSSTAAASLRRPQQSAPQMLPPEALNQLLAPIALYPDALVALILPCLDGAVRSGACRTLYFRKRRSGAGREPTVGRQCQVARPLSDDRKMDGSEILRWTTQVGEAFLDQPADVMNYHSATPSPGNSRGQPYHAPQQRIVKEEDCIRIVPVEPR